MMVKVLRRQREVERAQRLRKLVAAPGADEWDDILALGCHPGDGELRDAHALLVRHTS